MSVYVLPVVKSTICFSDKCANFGAIGRPSCLNIRGIPHSVEVNHNPTWGSLQADSRTDKRFKFVTNACSPQGAIQKFEGSVYCLPGMRIDDSLAIVETPPCSRLRKNEHKTFICGKEPKSIFSDTGLLGVCAVMPGAPQWGRDCPISEFNRLIETNPRAVKHYHKKIEHNGIFYPFLSYRNIVSIEAQ
ncbi:MAG: hypothetical protein WC520_02475 [Candidatus Paceibacterota bacterium]